MSADQQSRVCKLLFAILLIICWTPASSRPSPHLSQANRAERILSSIASRVKEGIGQQGCESKQDAFGRKMEAALVHGATYKGLNTLGSSPPSCEHKCGECNPCKAIQVPTNTDRVATHYANYEPEGWKCKCGSSVFNP